MEYYSTEKINDHITLLRSITGELLYLVEGQEKVALIDTCLGVGHLRSLVEKLTDKELLVLLTHGHIDHALGAPEFDRVYMNHKDLGLYQAQCPLPERKGYMQMGLAPEVFAGIEEKDFVPPTPDYQFLPLEDGMIFDLGELTIEAIAYPGHTKGSTAFLLKEDGILILGDACNNSTFLFGAETTSVEAYEETTKKVLERTKGRYSRVFISHHDMETGAEIMENMIELCEEIKAGTTDDVPFSFMGMEAFIAKKATPQMKRLDGKCGNLIYRKDHIYE